MASAFRATCRSSCSIASASAMTSAGACPTSAAVAELAARSQRSAAIPAAVGSTVVLSSVDPKRFGVEQRVGGRELRVRHGRSGMFDGLPCPSTQVTAAGGTDRIRLGEDVADDRVPKRPAGCPGDDPADLVCGLQPVVLLAPQQVTDRQERPPRRVRQSADRNIGHRLLGVREPQPRRQHGERAGGPSRQLVVARGRHTGDLVAHRAVAGGPDRDDRRRGRIVSVGGHLSGRRAAAIVSEPAPPRCATAAAIVSAAPDRSG